MLLIIFAETLVDGKTQKPPTRDAFLIIVVLILLLPFAAGFSHILPFVGWLVTAKAHLTTGRRLKVSLSNQL